MVGINFLSQQLKIVSKVAVSSMACLMLNYLWCHGRNIWQMMINWKLSLHPEHQQPHQHLYHNQDKELVAKPVNVTIDTAIGQLKAVTSNKIEMEINRKNKQSTISDFFTKCNVELKLHKLRNFCVLFTLSKPLLKTPIG